MWDLLLGITVIVMLGCRIVALVLLGIYLPGGFFTPVGVFQSGFLSVVIGTLLATILIAFWFECALTRECSCSEFGIFCLGTLFRFLVAAVISTECILAWSATRQFIEGTDGVTSHAFKLLFVSSILFLLQLAVAWQYLEVAFKASMIWITLASR